MIYTPNFLGDIFSVLSRFYLPSLPSLSDAIEMRDKREGLIVFAKKNTVLGKIDKEGNPKTDKEGLPKTDLWYLPLPVQANLA